MITTVGLDADDTLWHSQNHFEETQEVITELVSEWATPDEFAISLMQVERTNIASFGFGVKSFTLSAIEAAIDVSQGTIDPRAIAAIVEAGRELLEHPVELIDGVEETVRTLSESYRVVVITKGDLLHQQRKIDESGLGPLLDDTHIVSHKDPETYAHITAQLGVRPEYMVMAGNSLPSDVLPADAAGLHAVHVPYHLEWSYERAAVPAGSFATLQTIRDLPRHIGELNSRT